jgi:AraC-like DNA-binding protein
MDVLSSIAELLRLRGHSYGHITLGAPFAFSFPIEVGHFLIVTEGRCRLKHGAGQQLTLSTGDFVFLPSQDSFSLLSDDAEADLSPRPFSESEMEKYAQDGRLVIHGDADRGAEIVTGCFRFGPHEHSLLTEHLEGPLTFQMIGSTTRPWMTSIFQMIVEEAQPGRIGSFTIMDRLVEVLLIQALRAGMEGNHGAPSWLAALRDPLIGKSIRTMHFDIQQNWSVESLALSVGMSRSGFAARFKELVGRTPMEHLTRWRMLKAARMLTDDADSIAKIITAVGYTSESAFRRQFVEVLGVSPARYRKEQ